MSTDIVQERKTGIAPENVLPKAQKMHNGMLVMSESEFSRWYQTPSDDGTAKTFNFQGYVEDEEGRLHYQDVLATNGLRGGIHVGIDGTKSYREGKWDMKGPEDIGEYVVYITIPGETQKAEGVVCKWDSCYGVADFKARETQFSRDDTLENDLREAERIIKRSPEGEDVWIVDRLGFEPKEDAYARDKVVALNTRRVHHLMTGGRLEDTQRVIGELEEVLDQELPQSYGRLPQ